MQEYPVEVRKQGPVMQAVTVQLQVMLHSVSMDAAETGMEKPSISRNYGFVEFRTINKKLDVVLPWETWHETVQHDSGGAVILLSYDMSFCTLPFNLVGREVHRRISKAAVVEGGRRGLSCCSASMLSSRAKVSRCSPGARDTKIPARTAAPCNRYLCRDTDCLAALYQ